MQKTERIICSALVFNIDGIELALPVENNRLAMDTANYIIKHAPQLQSRTAFDEYFITSFGRVVNGYDGMQIALKANQLLDDAPTNQKLNSTMIRR